MTQCFNVQQGSNRTTARQTANATTGDGVGGQVIGAVSAGATSIDARNTTTNVSVDTGQAFADNGTISTTSLSSGNDLDTLATDISGIARTDNLQEGSNRATLTQSAGDDRSGQLASGERRGDATIAVGLAALAAGVTIRGHLWTCPATPSPVALGVVNFQPGKGASVKP